MAFPFNSTQDTTQFANALKTLYSDEAVEELVYTDNPLLEMIAKDEKFEGANFRENVITETPQGLGVSIAQAQTSSQASAVYKFDITRSEYFSSAKVSGAALEASQTNRGAFMKAVQLELDGSLFSLSRHLAVMMYGDGKGVIGTIGSITGAVITLSNPDDVTNFALGMLVSTYTDTTFGTQHSNGIQVVGRDASGGKITLAATTGSPANSDVIVRAGDQALVMPGLQAWLPFTAPTVGGGDSFYGTDRSGDSTRLAGCRYDGSAQQIDEAGIDGAKLVAREGGKPDYWWMSFEYYGRLIKALGPQVRYIDPPGLKANVGLKGVLVNVGKSQVTALPDVNCPDSFSFMLEMKSWKLRSLKKAPHIWDLDTMPFLRVSNADAIEARCVYRAALSNKAPGHSLIMKMQ